MPAPKDSDWKMDMDNKYNALTKNKICDLILHPPNFNVIDLCDFFRHKEKLNNYFERHKPNL